MPTNSVSNAFVAVAETSDYTAATIKVFTQAAHGAKAAARKPSKLSYYWRVMRWMWVHRAEPNNRAKWRRMSREIDT